MRCYAIPTFFTPHPAHITAQGKPTNVLPCSVMVAWMGSTRLSDEYTSECSAVLCEGVRNKTCRWRGECWIYVPGQLFGNTTEYFELSFCRLETRD